MDLTIRSKASDKVQKQKIRVHTSQLKCKQAKDYRQKSVDKNSKKKNTIFSIDIAFAFILF